MRKEPTKLYATHGEKEQLLGTKAVVNGVLSWAYMKGDRLVSYEPWADVKEQFESGQSIIINTAKLDLPKACEPA